MRARLALLIALGAGLLAAAPAHVGPYTLRPEGAGLEVRAPDDSQGGSMLVAAGLVVAALGALRMWRSGTELRGANRARVLIGLAMAGVGAAAIALGGTAWRVTPDGVAVHRRGGDEMVAPRASIEAVVIGRDRPDGAALKNPQGARPWTVSAGAARFRLASQAEAEQLAAAIAEPLGVPVRR